ncbi:hypothetical protein D3C87_1434310 [compost metagenome]
MDAHLAKTREVAQKQRCIVALGIEIGFRLEDDLVGGHLQQCRLVRLEIVEGERDRLEAFIVGDRGCGHRSGLGNGFGNGRCLRHFAVGKRLELLDQLAAARLVDAAAVAGGVRQVGQHVGRLQHHLQNLRTGLELVGTNAIKCRLEHVGEGDEVVEPESASATLDRVHGAKHGIDRFRIAVAVIELQKARFQFGELLLAFLEKDLFDFVHIHWRLSSDFRPLHARLHQSVWSGRTA